MANILIPPTTNDSENNLDLSDNLKKSNYLSEFTGSENVIRSNLDIPSNNEVIEKIEELSKEIANDLIVKAFSDHLESDSHGFLNKLKNQLLKYANLESNNKFTLPQSYDESVEITDKLNLVTKKFVEKLLNEHNRNESSHKLAELLTKSLSNYAKLSDVYTTTYTYSRQDIENILRDYVKRDGSTPFSRPQKGKIPRDGNDFVTKEYLDEIIKNYFSIEEIKEVTSAINKKVNQKIDISNVYSRQNTLNKYSIEQLVNKKVNESVNRIISEHSSEYDHLTLDDIKSVVEQSKVQISPQTQSLISTFSEINTLSDSCCYYTGHGPTESSDVGFITSGTNLTGQISYQELFDMIFYQSKVEVTTDIDRIEKGVCTPICVTMNVYGGKPVTIVELFFNESLIDTYDFLTEFVGGQKVVCGPTDIPNLCSATLIRMRVHYEDGSTQDATTNVSTSVASYFGLLPKWLFGTNLTYIILQQLVDHTVIDSTIPIYGGNTIKYIGEIVPGTQIPIHYDFPYDGIARHPFAFYPKSSTGKLYEMDTVSQQFNPEFYITDIPILLPDGSTEIYESYIYTPALTSWNTDVTFKFN